MTLRTMLLLLAAVTALAGERRAVIVGIDRYLLYPGETRSVPSGHAQSRMKAIQGHSSRISIPTLRGAVNDAVALKQVLIDRFGFEERDIVLLTNEEATAERILTALETHLIDNAEPGDAALFYFAGHGSRIRNTSPHNANQTGYDSTLVPADSLLGVPDIRSKELARIYNRAAQKGVTLTVMHDSCYSGAASRGPVSARIVRSEPGDEDVSVNETLDAPLPEEQGVLVIAASQDYEPAAELATTDLGGAHGVFTWALLHALSTTPVNASVDRIFQRARALMQSKAPSQEPVLLAKKGRNNLGLFGQKPDTAHRLTIAAGRVSGSVVKLNAGLAANLNEGCELKRIEPPTPELEVRITKVNGVSQSEAVVSRRGRDDDVARPGDLFELVRWVAADRELLRVYIPPPAPPQELALLAKVGAQLRKSKSLHFIDDPSTAAPTHILTWDSENSQWTLRENRPNASPVVLPRLSAEAVVRSLPKAPAAKLFLQFPPPEATAKTLTFENAAVAKADSPALADYVLLGRLEPKSEQVTYAWALAEPDGKLPSRPLRTDWFTNEKAAGSLKTTALDLARVTGWLNLAPPSTENAAPFQLALENIRTRQVISSGQLTGGEKYRLLLRLRDKNAADMDPRRIYVFVVDSFGEAHLLFGDNLDNQFPRPGQPAMAELTPLTSDDEAFGVGKPWGVDHYFLLTTATPLDNPETVLSFHGVRTRGAEKPPADPLSKLLANTASGRRGGVTGVPLNWSIEHLTFVSSPK